MQFAYGKLTIKHRALLLKNALFLYGLDCTVTHSSSYFNTYETILAEPEVIYPDEQSPPVGANLITCKILIDEPIEGMLMDGPVISLSDKVDTQFTITTDTLLEMQDRLEVTFPDGRLLHFRIVERLSKHPFTTIGFKYKGVVV